MNNYDTLYDLALQLLGPNSTREPNRSCSSCGTISRPSQMVSHVHSMTSIRVVDIRADFLIEKTTFLDSASTLAQMQK